MYVKLFLIAALSAGLVMSCESRAQNSNLSVDEFEKAIAEKNIQLLDVRTREEYLTDHLKNTLWADWNDRNEFMSRVKALDKSKPVYTYCLSGARSSAATEWLRKQGFIAYNMSGGISAWKRAGKPVEGFKEVKQITMQEYLAQIPADKTVLVDFSAVWCPPCKVMAPVVESLVKQHGSDFVLLKMDGAAQTDICRELTIEAFPTFIIYKKGKEVWRKQGIVEAKEFVSHF
ncbi:MAG TPA: thioredoxin domain-containing protein [Puia sp.]|nr:thioredoxin domain-containing protein [Puia sp.]